MIRTRRDYVGALRRIDDLKNQTRDRAEEEELLALERGCDQWLAAQRERGPAAVDDRDPVPGR